MAPHLVSEASKKFFLEMKLREWMHCELKQTCRESTKDLTAGNTCNCLLGQPSHDDQCCHRNMSYGLKSCKVAKSDNHPQKPFPSLGADILQEDGNQQEPSIAISELFHGYLAIDTLGSANGLGEPQTSTFTNLGENVTEKDAEAENELNLLNDELEKVLDAEARDEWYSVSSERTSPVRTGRSSNDSTVSLQGFLFGSEIDMSETTAAENREYRTSLRDLFQINKTSDESWGTNIAIEEKRAGLKVGRSAVLFLKNKLKKIILNHSWLNIDSMLAALNKTRHVLHMKVHPENSAFANKSGKRQKKKSKSKFASKRRSTSRNQDEENMAHHQRPKSKEHFLQLNSQHNPTQFNHMASELNGNGECWIKTDPEYIVLVL